jgi:uncharacterized protein (DUF2147 family)
MRLAPFIIACAALAAPTFAAVPVAGRYYTDGKDSIVLIGPCGPVVCGKIAKIIKGPPGGGRALDSNNPDPKLRSRPIEGLVILSDFKDAGGEWEGKIYDPRAGKTYRSTMVKQPDGSLKVKGCVGPFCKAVKFTPAP